MGGFNESIKKLVSLVVLEPHLESAWLTTLAHMEHLAAEQVLGSISRATPLQALSAIREHAADEFRHRDHILKIRPYAEPANSDYATLRLRLKNIAESFVQGYFANPILQKAKNRFAAYVHGALTIEQFPFQIYSAYILATSHGHVRECMQEILAEETEHIVLGRRLRENLAIDEMMPLQELHHIEREMCHKMVSRMIEVVAGFLSPIKKLIKPQPSHQLVVLLRERPVATLAWIYTLGKSEFLAASHMQKIFTNRQLTLPVEMLSHIDDEVRHSRLLQRSVLLERRKYLHDPSYRQLERRMLHAMERYMLKFFSDLMHRYSSPEEIYLYGAWGLEQRVFKHYSDIVKETENIGVAQILDGIVIEEAAHAQMVHRSLAERKILSLEKFREVKQLEEGIFESSILGVIELLQGFDLQFFPPYRTDRMPVTTAEVVF
ncbi:ferritin-like domain-containing protein [Bdellovibrio sp. HCB2-146]|uniref:ferritin-like domain-containing protein n=1 Tax=Bdellovibrio sp. HCB2-146 TaxID=3394362 RepID=UPI0039BCC8D8